MKESTIKTKNKTNRQSFKKVAYERVGETRLNTMGSQMWIIEYVNYNDITVQFKEGYMVKTYYGEFLKGKVKNPYDASVFGVGYLGVGYYKTGNEEGHTEQYNCWNQMLRRCYSIKAQERNPTYKGCTVCEEWHNFQNFAKWYDENFYHTCDEVMCLDKDILVRNNKVYSPNTCCFLPQSINVLLIKSDRTRGLNPIGVYFNKLSNKYQASCCDGNSKSQYLGLFDSPEIAFQAYKKYKESIIKLQAEKYKKFITKEVYQSLINYEVNIDD